MVKPYVLHRNLFILSLVLLLSSISYNSSAQVTIRNVEHLTADTSGWKLVKEWIKSAKNKVEVLPASRKSADKALYQLQVTTRSPMGAITYFTGGILIDNGWIRILGSGNDRLNRSIPSWNKGKTFNTFGEPPQFLLVADDAVGGLFAINGGALGSDLGKMYHLSPDRLEWEPMNFGYADFLNFCFAGDINNFYSSLRWKRWKEDLKNLSPDQGFFFYPYLWSEEGQDINKVQIKRVPIEEIYIDAINNIKTIKH